MISLMLGGVGIVIEFFGGILGETVINIQTLRGEGSFSQILECLLSEKDIAYVDFTQFYKLAVPKFYIIVLGCSQNHGLVFE